MLDDGTVERRVRLVRPLERTSLSVDALPATTKVVAEVRFSRDRHMLSAAI